MTIQCFGVKSSQKWEYDQKTTPPFGKREKIIMKLINVNY